MSIILEFIKWLKNWTYLIAFISLIITIVNYLIRRAVIIKLTEHDIKDLQDIAKKAKEQSENLLDRVTKIEKNIQIHKSICEERHKDK